MRRTRIKPISDKLRAARAVYNARVREWIKGKRCAVYRTIPATQCHHQRGRLGSLLMDERFWIPVSSAGHARIGTGPEWARRTFAFLTDGRALTLLCQRGEWNTPVKP